MNPILHSLALEGFRRDLQSIAGNGGRDGRPTVIDLVAERAGAARQRSLVIRIPGDLYSLLEAIASAKQAETPDATVSPADIATILILCGVVRELEQP